MTVEQELLELRQQVREALETLEARVQRALETASYHGTEHTDYGRDPLIGDNLVGHSHAAISFPIVEATATSTTSPANTLHSVTLPSGIASGNLLLVCFAVEDNAGPNLITWPSGWTGFLTAANSNNVRMAVGYRKADGTEGSTIIITTSLSRRSAHQSYRITAAEDPSIQPPQASTGATGTSAAPNPDELLPAASTKKYLWFAVGADVTGAFTTAPTNYVGLLATATGGVGIGSARRSVEDSTQDPGAFTLDSSRPWVAATIAIHPGTAQIAGITEHDLFSTAHPDMDDSDIPAASELLQYDGTQWKAEPASGHGSHSAAGAPTNAQYLVITNDATLTDERAIALGGGLSGADAGAGSTYTIRGQAELYISFGSSIDGLSDGLS